LELLSGLKKCEILTFPVIYPKMGILTQNFAQNQLFLLFFKSFKLLEQTSAAKSGEKV